MAYTKFTQNLDQSCSYVPSTRFELKHFMSQILNECLNSSQKIEYNSNLGEPKEPNFFSILGLINKFFYNHKFIIVV